MAQKNNNQYDAACLRMRCKNNKVEVQFGSEVHICEGSGPQQVSTSAFSGVIKCPAYSEMCTEVLEKRCPMDCYGQGICMSNGTCQCLGGFSGDDCNDGLPKEQDPFVTDFDIRKQGDQPEEPKDDEEERENEDDKDREEEKEEDDEEEKEEEKEEEEEEQGDKDTPLSQKAKELIAKITKNEKHFDFWAVRSVKIDWKIAKSDLCAQGTEKRNEKCQKRKTHFENKHGASKNKEAEILVNLEMMENDLGSELTETQHANRLISQAQRETERKSERTDKIIDYYQAKIRRAEAMVKKWEKNQTKYTETIQKYQGNSGFTESAKKLQSWIDWMQTYADYWRSVLNMTQDKLKAIEDNQEKKLERLNLLIWLMLTRKFRMKSMNKLPESTKSNSKEKEITSNQPFGTKQ